MQNAELTRWRVERRAVLAPKETLHRRMSSAAAVEGATTRVTTAERLSLAEEVLDGGEIVLLAIKPSLWFVVFDSARWIVFGALLLVVSVIPSLQIGSLSSATVAEVACMVIVVRMGIALLRWVSRFYVLTNRRIMRLCGVFKADLRSCPLLAIRHTSVSVGPHERLTKLGTILFVYEGTPSVELNWYTIAKCEEVHDRVRRAIERAIDSQPRA